MMAVVTFLGTIGFVIGALVASPQYTTHTRIASSNLLRNTALLPGLGRLAGAADDYGFGLSGLPSRTALLFPELLRGRLLLRNVLARDYPTQEGGTVSLLDVLAVPEGDRRERLDVAVATKGRRLLALSTDLKSGVTTVRVTLGDPVLAAAVANAAAEELNLLVGSLRAAHAGEKASFVFQRRMAVRDSLLAQEESLRSFREHNRITVGSPGLMMREDRLRRRMAMNEQLFLALQAEYEMARLEELSSMPDVVVIEPATVPVVRSSPRRSRMVVLGALFSGAAALTLALGLEAARRMWAPSPRRPT